MSDREIGALIWARELKMGDTLFRYIKVRARFRFKEDSEWFTKTSARWFVDAQGRKFTTGQNTAVFKEE
jgi:hypothetical protein